MRIGRVAALGALAVLTTTLAPPSATAATPPTATPPVDGRYQEFGDAAGFLNVIPPGQDGTLTPPELAQAQAAGNDPTKYPPHYADQESLYSALTFSGDNLNDADLTKYYKDASFGVKNSDVARKYSPNPDVTVLRDKQYGVPHIYGRTRYATMFAEGYTSAEDRFLEMDLLRHLAQGRLAELVGAPAAGMDQAGLTNAPYTAADLQKQLDDMKESGPEGASVVEDFIAYTDGVNKLLAEGKPNPSLLPAEYGVIGKAPEPWRVTDAVSIASEVGAQFGKGGGREVENLCGIDKLTAAYAVKTEAAEAAKPAGTPKPPEAEDAAAAARNARAEFGRLKFDHSPEAPTTSSRAVSYGTNLGKADPSAIPPVACASLQPVGGARDPVQTRGLGSGPGPLALPPALQSLLAQLTPAGPSQAVAQTPAMSNAILVSGKHTNNGRPIAVFGPQVGYQVPAALVEKDVHGPGIDARGVGFAGVDQYVLLGRGRDYAWSATSSGADNVDDFVLKLCDPNGGPVTTASMGYEYKGKCKPIDSFQHVERTTTGLAGAGTPTTLTWTIERTSDYGPLVDRGTLKDGTPIAVARKRSTYGREIQSAIGFKRLNDPKTMNGGLDAFRRATGSKIDYTFNWFYVDATTIGYQHSCRCPKRATGTTFDLPAWGNGKYDWQGHISPADQPWDANPPAGFITSWNNKQAARFHPADDQYSFGPVHRVQLLNTRITKAISGNHKVDRAAVVRAMKDASTADLRGEADLPLLLQVLTDPPAGIDPRALDLRERLETWAAAGAHRRAKSPGAPYDDAVAIAAMDAWWKNIPGAMFAVGTTDPFTALDFSIDDNPSRHGGSSFDTGAYSHVAKALRQVLGQPVTSPFPATSFCNGGTLPQCRALLWQTLAKTVHDLETEFGSPTVDDWQRKPADDEIQFSSLLVSVPPMNWVNRPTFQQVVQLATRGRASKSAAAGGDSNTGAIVIVLIAGALVAIAVSLIVRRRHRRHATAPATPPRE
jgi:acyl-homoserine lactone acylase PvdQ